MHRLNLNGYEPDRHHEAAVAFCIHAGTDELTSPVHQHRKRAVDTGTTWCNYLYGGKCFVDGAATICGLDTGRGET